MALSLRDTSLPRPSVANVTQLVTLDRDALMEQAGTLAAPKLDLILSGIGILLGRS